MGKKKEVGIDETDLQRALECLFALFNMPKGVYDFELIVRDKEPRQRKTDLRLDLKITVPATAASEK